jgi:hypothetical protein
MKKEKNAVFKKNFCLKDCGHLEKDLDQNKTSKAKNPA